MIVWMIDPTAPATRVGTAWPGASICEAIALTLEWTGAATLPINDSIAGATTLSGAGTGAEIVPIAAPIAATEGRIAGLLAGLIARRTSTNLAG